MVPHATRRGCYSSGGEKGMEGNTQAGRCLQVGALPSSEALVQYTSHYGNRLTGGGENLHLLY